ncbi:MAG: 30S ribosomal protein S6 [Saprospiraceae bacterium]|nr:30S ribosomal protein S6 [Saprospiraceae bacterium]
MRNHEVTFIVDPVLSGDEIKATAQAYADLIKKEGAQIVHTDEMGLRQLAYPINRRTSGVYYCIEFQSDTGAFIPKMELSFRRDERIMRFLTVSLDKYGIKYNVDKRDGKIGKAKKRVSKAAAAAQAKKAAQTKAAPKPAPKPPAPKKAATPPPPVAKSEEE